MLIKCGHELIFELPAPAQMLLMLYTHPVRAGDLRQPVQLQIEPYLPVQDYIDTYGNRCGRIVAPAGRLRLY